MKVKMLETVSEPPNTYPAGTEQNVPADMAMRWLMAQKAVPTRPQKPSNAREVAIPPSEFYEKR